jgi:hypothetical protein
MSKGRPSAYLFPVVLVFKKTNRINSKPIMKVYKTKNIDDVLDGLHGKTKLPGVPKTAIVLALGVGDTFVEKYMDEFNIGNYGQ